MINKTQLKQLIAVLGAGLAFNAWALSGFPSPWQHLQTNSAAWQAVGSVGAILVAVWVAHRQGEQAQEIARESQRQTLKIAEDARRLTETLAAQEQQRSEAEAVRAKNRAGLWISLVLADVMQEADRMLQLLAEPRIPNEERVMQEGDRGTMLNNLQMLRFAHADAMDSILVQCERLPEVAAHQVMRVLRTLGHYSTHLEMVISVVPLPTTLYSTVAQGLVLRRDEAHRVREIAKEAHDILERAVPVVRSRAAMFTDPALRHLAGPIEEVR